MLQAFVAGVGGGGVFLLSQALLPDVIEHDFHKTGMRREGVLAGVYAFVEKASSALGLLALGALLTGMGYIQGIRSDVGVQPQSALLAIRLATSLIPAGVALMAVLIIAQYNLRKDNLRANDRGISMDLSQFR